MDLIQKGIEKGYIKFDEEGKFITYVRQNKKRNYNNPEEKVQAEVFLKLILIYGYSDRRILQFVPVKVGSDTKEADLIVYNDDACLEPHIIVECKKQDVSELEFEQAIEQAFAYAFATAKTIKYIWVSSGLKDIHYKFNKEKDEKTEIPDIPPYGVDKLAAYKYVKGGDSGLTAEEPEVAYGKQKFFELETVTEDELTRRFRQAHQSLWAGGELNPSEAFDELDKLIFCKIWDEIYTIDEEKNAFRPRRNGEPYQFQIFTEENEAKTTEELSKRIKRLYAEGKKRDPEVFKDDIRLTPPKIKTVVGYLESVNLSKTDLDSKGKAFETFMGSYFRGDFGQFFTPRNIVKFIVEVLPIENSKRVLDTSCGSGGFLLYALDKVRQQASDYFPNWQTDTQEATDHFRYWHDFAEKNLFGIEINEQIARTAKMNMIIHDDGHTNVIAADGLSLTDELIRRSGNNEFKDNSFNFIITNPPFGSTVKQTERAYMHQYKLAVKDADWLDIKKKGVKHRANQSTEVMFIERCQKFLKPGGYLAIVIPDGILTNSSMQYVRDLIEEWYRIVAVVSMPQDAFAHTGAAVKSSVMFLRKWNTEISEKIANQKADLQQRLRKEQKYEKQVAVIEYKKKDIIKKHTAFVNNTGETERKAIEKTDAFKEWKKQITDEYNRQIADLKDQMNDLYMDEKQKTLADYPIFMAIAEKIGYDATGKTIPENELEIIGQELKHFIQYIEKEEKV
jgi:type I restriction enzyme M protein